MFHPWLFSSIWQHWCTPPHPCTLYTHFLWLLRQPASLPRLFLFCMLFISEYFGGFSLGSSLSLKIIFSLVYALPWLQLTLLCWWTTIANLQPDFSSELHPGISNDRLPDVDILWPPHIQYSLNPCGSYTSRVQKECHLFFSDNQEYDKGSKIELLLKLLFLK